SYPMVLRYAHLAPSHAAEAAERVAQWAHSEIPARKPHERKKAGKPGKCGGAEGDRTLDLRIANATLSQLSYRPTAKHPAKSRSSQTASECPAIKMRDFAAAPDNHPAKSRSSQTASECPPSRCAISRGPRAGARF